RRSRGPEEGRPNLERREHPEYQRNQAARSDLHGLPRAAAAQLALGADHPQHRPSPAPDRAHWAERPAPGSVSEPGAVSDAEPDQGPEPVQVADAAGAPDPIAGLRAQTVPDPVSSA